jgi:hypothetical protein
VADIDKQFDLFQYVVDRLLIEFGRDGWYYGLFHQQAIGFNNDIIVV